jgi:RNA ligase (TIGR02306 family)
MRDLATIQKIKSLNPIPNADKIVVAKILGWDVVVGKNDFNVGDWCLYIEIDSILPDHPLFEFLKNSKGKVQRIRTIRMRGQVSQGIAFPMSVLQQLCVEKFGPGKTMIPLKAGYDVSGIVGVVKYEPPADDSSQPGPRVNMRSKGKLPSYVPKTDQTRIQNLEQLIRQYQGTKFWVSEKLDGSSWSVYYNNGEYGVCSRNFDITRKKAFLIGRIKRWISRYIFRKREMSHKDRIDAWNKIAIKYDLENRLKEFGRNIVPQGEIVGPKVQKNKYHLDEVDIHLFDVYDIDKGVYVDYEELVMITEALGMKMVPVIDTNFVLGHSIDDLILMADGSSILRKETLREGLVFKPLQEIYDPSFDRLYRSRISFKAVSNKFLLKHGG